MDYLMYTVVTGLGATVVMDVWGLVRKALLGMPLSDYGLVGRWLAYMPTGKFHHTSIAAAPAVAGERVIGWTAHYVIGVAYAALLIGITGPAWMQHPTLVPALLIGISTVVAPFFLMQPGMGAGIAAARTPRPNVVRLHSVINHAVFGAGLYAAGWAAHFLYAL